MVFSFSFACLLDATPHLFSPFFSRSSLDRHSPAAGTEIRPLDFASPPHPNQKNVPIWFLVSPLPYVFEQRWPLPSISFLSRCWLSIVHWVPHTVHGFPRPTSLAFGKLSLSFTPPSSVPRGFVSEPALFSFLFMKTWDLDFFPHPSLLNARNAITLNLF